MNEILTIYIYIIISRYFGERNTIPLSAKQAHTRRHKVSLHIAYAISGSVVYFLCMHASCMYVLARLGPIEWIVCNNYAGGMMTTSNYTNEPRWASNSLGIVIELGERIHSSRALSVVFYCCNLCIIIWFRLSSSKSMLCFWKLAPIRVVLAHVNVIDLGVVK